MKKHRLPYNLRLIRLKDGRIGLGQRFTYRGIVYYWVQGKGFDVDNFREEDIEWSEFVRKILLMR